ncbi:MAG: GNAT family N-acetyltransferase [Methanobacteriota archaeon]
MPVRLRRLRLVDHPAVLALARASGLPLRPKGRESRTAFARQLRSHRTSYVGAFDGERLVGMVLGTHDSRKGWINRLAVHPEFRRRGIGRRLVRASEAALRRTGIEMFAALIEENNEASVVFFRSIGYETARLWYARRRLRKGI